MQTTASVLPFARTADAVAKRAAEDAARAFISQNGLTFRPSPSELGYVGARAFAAFGTREIDAENGWAIRVVARESRFLDGLDFEIRPLFRLCGEEWAWVPSLRDGSTGFLDSYEWTTSATALSRGLGASYDAAYFNAIGLTFESKRLRRVGEVAAEQLAEALRKQYACDSDGKIALAAGGVCRIGSSGQSAYASFQFSLSDPEQIAAVMAVVNSRVATRSPDAVGDVPVQHFKMT